MEHTNWAARRREGGRGPTITRQDGLGEIGRIAAATMRAMGAAMEPGTTTREPDGIGRDPLEREEAVPAPRSSCGFPGATCIGVNEEIAHGVPGDRAIARGDLVDIDVSASKDGYLADTGASCRVPPTAPALDRLCRDGRRAMRIGIAQVAGGKPLAGIGEAIGRFASRRNDTLVRNLASHGSAGRRTRIPGRSRPGPRMATPAASTRPSCRP